MSKFMSVFKLALFIVPVLFVSQCFALAGSSSSQQQVTYYAGFANLTSLLTGTVEARAAILKRIVDPSSGFMAEIACFQEGDKASVSPAYMWVSSDATTASVSDLQAPGTSDLLTGSVKMFGPLWNWNYLQFSMQYRVKNGFVKIEDSNFYVPHQLIFRKQLFYFSDATPAVGTPIQLCDGVLNQVTSDQYEIQKSAMNCAPSMP